MKLDKRIKEEMRPFFKIKPLYYWADLLISVSCFYTAYFFAVKYWGNWVGFSATLIVTYSIYRLGSYLHELVHHPNKLKKQLLAYEWTFGHIFGLTYLGFTSHHDHHAIKTYGTKDDPEYSVDVKSIKMGIVVSIGSGILGPIVLLIRYSIVALLMPFMPKNIQKKIFKYASFQGFNINYQRPVVKEEYARQMAWRELPTGVIRTSILSLIALNYLSINILYVYLCATSIALTVNMFRAIFAHQYTSNNVAQDFDGQIEDSINIEGGILMELFAPVGLQYHALHHLFSMIPAYNLPKAHKRMMELNYDWYNDITYKSLGAAIMDRAADNKAEIKKAS